MSPWAGGSLFLTLRLTNELIPRAFTPVRTAMKRSPRQRATTAAHSKADDMKPSYRYRSAVTGRYVSAAFAKCHPKTTIRERVK